MRLVAQPQTFLASIPDGRGGTKETLKLMRELVKAGKRSPTIRFKATDIVRPLPAKNWLAEINALFEFVRSNVRYTKDILGVETLHTAEQVLEQGVGDCDDMTILLASLLGSIGHPTRFIACKFKPGQFSHVYLQTRVGKKWLSLDPTTNYPMGWQPPNIHSCIVMDN